MLRAIAEADLRRLPSKAGPIFGTILSLLGKGKSREQILHADLTGCPKILVRRWPPSPIRAS